MAELAGAVAFFWAVNHDQFDDMDTPGLLPLADSDLVAGGNLPQARPFGPAEAGAEAAAEPVGRSA